MPQLTQLPDVFWSQLFWLAVVFGILYVGIGRAMLPKIEATIERRGDRIADDLAAAQAARTAADAVEGEYRARLDESRAEAAKLAAEAKAAAARANEERVRSAGEEIGAKTEAAEARIRASAEAALADIDAVAAEAAQDMVQRLAGLSVSADRAARAVKAVAHG